MRSPRGALTLLVALVAPALPGIAPAQQPRPAAPAPLHADSSGAYGSYQRGTYLTAFAQAIDAASNGDAAAMTLLGQLYAEGRGVPKSAARAAEWYVPAVMRGDPRAMTLLSEMLATGTGITRDPDRAMSLLQRAAEAGDPAAQLKLALVLMDGPNRAKEMPRVVSLLTAAAEGGAVDAQYALGLLHGGDELGPPDAAKAARWMGEAARTGFADAEVEYALMLANGRGVPKDLDGAVKLLSRAAFKGHPVAQNRLARARANGIGGPLDQVEAARWHLLAKAGGLNDPQLDTMVAGLPPAERLKVDLKVQQGLYPTNLPTGRFGTVLVGAPSTTTTFQKFKPAEPGTDLMRNVRVN